MDYARVNYVAQPEDKGVRLIRMMGLMISMPSTGAIGTCRKRIRPKPKKIRWTNGSWKKPEIGFMNSAAGTMV